MDSTPYVDLDVLKSVLNIKTPDRVPRLEAAAAAATDAINSACDRDFHRPAETAADEERYYTPDRPRTLQIDDVLEIHELATDQTGIGQFTIVWEQNRDFTLEPLNAPLKGRPFERVKVHPLTRFLLIPRPRSVRITGVFGWPEVPPSVVTMCTILATKLYKRPDAPFGIASFGAEVAMQVLRTDPDYMLLLGDYLRDPIVYG